MNSDNSWNEAEEAMDRLLGKMVNEINNFIESVRGMSGQQIIERMISYEMIYKEDILMCFEDDELVLSNEEIDFLLGLEYPLDWLYQKWLKFDCSHMEMLRGFIECVLSEEI